MLSKEAMEEDSFVTHVDPELIFMPTRECPYPAGLSITQSSLESGVVHASPLFPLEQEYHYDATKPENRKAMENMVYQAAIAIFMSLTLKDF